MPTTPYVGFDELVGQFIAQQSPQIIQRATDTSVALATLRQVPVSARTLRMNLVDTFPTAQWLLPGAPPNDDVDIVKKPTTKMSWTTQDLTVEEAATMVVIPENILDDSEINLWTEVETRTSEAIARLIDSAVFFGTVPGGGSIPASFPVGGLYGRAVAAGNEIAGTDDFAEDLNDLLGMVEEDGFDASRAWSGTGVRAQLRGLRDNQGQFIYSSGMQGGVPATTIWGVPISYVTSQGVWDKTKSSMIAGDPSFAVIGMRQKLTAKRLDQATIGDINLAEQDALALRVKIRLGWTVVVPKAPGQTGTPFPFATLSPFVPGP